MPYPGPEACYQQSLDEPTPSVLVGSTVSLLLRSNFLIRNTALHLFTFHFGSILCYSQIFLSDWQVQCLFSDCF